MTTIYNKSYTSKHAIDDYNFHYKRESYNILSIILEKIECFAKKGKNKIVYKIKFPKSDQKISVIYNELTQLGYECIIATEFFDATMKPVDVDPNETWLIVSF